MRNNRISTVLILLLFVALIVSPILAGCGTKSSTAPDTEGPSTPAAPAPEPEETIEINFIAGAEGLIGLSGQALPQWFEEIEKASGGRVKINVLLGAAPPFGLFDALVSGSGDLSGTMLPYNSGRFPATELLMMDDVGTRCLQTSQALWDMWQQSPEIQEEFSDIKMIAMWGAPPSPPGIGFGTVNKPVYTVEDMKGLKVGVVGEWATKFMQALGASPTPLPPPEVYEGLQRGIVDGSFCDASMLVDWKFQEVIKYYHYASYQWVPFWQGMNWDTWNSLPPDIQKIFEDTAPNICKRADEYNIPACVNAVENARKEYGVEVIEYSPAELAKWREAQKPVQEEYFAMLETMGIDGRDFLDRWHGICAKYE